MIHFIQGYLILFGVTILACMLLCWLVFGFNFEESVEFTILQTIAGVPWSPFVVIGLFVCGYCSARKLWVYDTNHDLLHWKYTWMWPWDNEESGVVPTPQLQQNLRWNAFVWTALRNPVDNMKYVFKHPGWPLFRKTWGPKPGGWYFQAGWNSSGLPVFSGGRNVNKF